VVVVGAAGTKEFVEVLVVVVVVVVEFKAGVEESEAVS